MCIRDRKEDSTFLHVNDLDRCAVQNQLSTGILIGQTHHILAIGNSLVNAAGAFADLAVHILKQVVDVLPCLIVLVAAHCKQHIGQVCKSGRGVGGVGSGDFTLQGRVQQIFVALDLDVTDEVGVDDEDAAVQHIAGDEAALVLVCLLYTSRCV